MVNLAWQNELSDLKKLFLIIWKFLLSWVAMVDFDSTRHRPFVWIVIVLLETKSNSAKYRHDVGQRQEKCINTTVKLWQYVYILNFLYKYKYSYFILQAKLAE